MKNKYLFYGLLIIGAVIVWNLLQPTTVTTNEAGQPVAGQGTDPYGASPYSVENLADLGGIATDIAEFA